MFAILSGAYLSNPSVSSNFSPPLPFFVTAVLSFLSFLAISTFFKETHPMKAKFRIDILKGFRDVKETFGISQLRVLYLILLLWLLGWGIAFQWYNPYALQRFRTPVLEINWGLFIVGITWMLGGYFVNNYIIKRWHPRPWVVAANGTTALCLLAMAFSTSFYPFALFFLIGCIPSAFSWPNILNLISINAPASVQGKVMGLSQSAQSTGQILGTILGGIVAATLLSGLYFFATAFVLISFFLILYFHIKKTALSNQ